MTTPANKISFTDIQTEFGGVKPISLNEYYSNGIYVPIGLHAAGSGTISMNQLRNLTNYSTLVKSQTGISTSTGTFVANNFTQNLNGYGPYPVRTLDSLTWSAAWPVRSISIYQIAYIDYGFCLYYGVNGTWVTTPNGIPGTIVHASGAQGTVSANFNFTFPTIIPAGSVITFAFSTGPYWQQILSSGQVTITYNRA